MATGARDAVTFHAVEIPAAEDFFTAQGVTLGDDIGRDPCDFFRSGGRRIGGDAGGLGQHVGQRGVAAADRVHVAQRPLGEIGNQLLFRDLHREQVGSVLPVEERGQHVLGIILGSRIGQDRGCRSTGGRQVHPRQTGRRLHTDWQRSLLRQQLRERRLRSRIGDGDESLDGDTPQFRLGLGVQRQ